ncbi:nuclease-related domain-containing protein [Fundicoccus sp. Sow4_H7]|uniref:nuclease-related domain-containing protein n=1 Tax=Fundicoccus sp. Sow4_H7 TaxID=3438784 RepID=UPI003F904524
MEKNEQLIYFEMLDLRGALDTKELQREFTTLRKGYEGEALFYSYFKAHAPQNWVVYYDYSFDFDGKAQIDFLLVSNQLWYLIEVKNYSGHLDYTDNTVTINNKIYQNIFRDLDNRTVRLKRLVATVSRQITVTPIMIFIGADFTYTLNQKPSMTVIPRTAIKHFLTKLPPVTPLLNYQQTQNTLNKYKTPYQIKYHRLEPEAFVKIRKGIHCANCSSYNVERMRSCVRCGACSHLERLEFVISRKAFELIGLFPDHPEILTVANLHQ